MNALIVFTLFGLVVLGGVAYIVTHVDDFVALWVGFIGFMFLGRIVEVVAELAAKVVAP